MLAVIGFLGILLSGSVIYFLALRRIRLARCQSYFIINVAVSDVLVSLLGVFRGLGIINSRFVGAPNNNTTPFCAIYKIFLTTFACSGISVLLPLTIDRAVAITLPLRHSSIITKKTCVVMFLANWLPNLALMLYEVIAWLTGTIQIEYNDRYYRCLMVTGLIVGNIEKFCFVIIPFLLVLTLYATIMVIIFKRKIRIGRFLITASGIIITGLVAYSPTVVTAMWHIPHSYEVSQILTVTVYYINGIVNPLIYLATHPKTREYVDSRLSRSRARRSTSASVVQPSVARSSVVQPSVVQPSVARSSVVQSPLNPGGGSTLTRLGVAVSSTLSPLEIVSLPKMDISWSSDSDSE